ncbi:MAG: NAD/NADP octopine/nopaline dehydrogenase family protein [Terrisporobacter sp.]|uniref:NAD/NADP octopine/nopaline dehydrogenase family protein n=1 Tax=Terrisporobacter sp. TaxID=1965305 RepID=UPI002FCC461D
MKIEKVAIIGAGNGGITAAADLTEKGFKVNIFESERFCKKLDVIKQNNEITIEFKGNSSIQNINLITRDIKEAIKDCEIVMITVPGMGIEYFAEIIAPVVEENQIILINGAPAMSAVRFINKAKEMGIDKNFKVGETNSLTYATRALVEEAKVDISLKAGKVHLAAYPSCNTDEVYDACVQIYDCFVKSANVIQVNLENPNPLVHPGPTLLNAGRIDYTKGEFWLYKEGITEHTINIVKAVEEEREAVANALDIKLEDVNQGRINRGYFVDEDKPMHELFNTSPVFKNIKGPATVTGRYIVEDISTGLVLWSDLGKALDVKTPNIDSIIVLGGTLIQRDFYEEGLTLESLGLGNLRGKEELLANI